MLVTNKYARHRACMVRGAHRGEWVIYVPPPDRKNSFCTAFGRVRRNDWPSATDHAGTRLRHLECTRCECSDSKGTMRSTSTPLISDPYMIFLFLFGTCLSPSNSNNTGYTLWWNAVGLETKHTKHDMCMCFDSFKVELIMASCRIDLLGCAL